MIAIDNPLSQPRKCRAHHCGKANRIRKPLIGASPMRSLASFAVALGLLGNACYAAEATEADPQEELATISFSKIGKRWYLKN
jgi:hypothetical protein